MLVKIRIAIFALALLLGILSLATGLILYFWPHGPRAGQLEIFGFTKNGWAELHTWFSILSLIVIAVHLAVNRTSIRMYWKYLKGSG
jgi:hypothetical protein